MKHRKHQEWKRSGKMSQHHLRPSSRGGESIGSNLLILDTRRHEAWHLLFNNLTIQEVIELLQRTQHIKEHKRFKKMLYA